MCSREGNRVVDVLASETLNFSRGRHMASEPFGFVLETILIDTLDVI